MESRHDVAELMNRQCRFRLPVTLVADAARIMAAQRVSGLPVLDDQGHLVGIVTEGDLLRRAEIGTDGAQAGWLKSLLMHRPWRPITCIPMRAMSPGVMTHNPVFVTPETPLEEAANLMLRKRIKRLPVMTHGRLAGVISPDRSAADPGPQAAQHPGRGV